MIHPFLIGFTVNIKSGTRSYYYVLSTTGFFFIGAFKFLSNKPMLLLSAAKILSLPLTFLFYDILLLFIVKTLNISIYSYELL